MLRVALTGGIASGKTTIAKLFQQLDVAVIDADHVSHQLMAPGADGYQLSLDHFGPAILNPDNSLNRAMLRQIVFDDEAQKLWLESMLHPLIRERCLELMDAVERGSYLLLVVPLLFETGFDRLVHYIIAIDCPAEIQLQRLLARDGIDRALATKMIAAQLPNEQRLQLADDVIGNADNQPRDDDILTMHQKLVRIALTNKDEM